MKENNDLIENFRNKAKGLTGRNHYAAFLVRAVLNELNVLAAEKMGKKYNMVDFTPTPVPVGNPGFRSFPVEFDLTDETYELEQEAFSEWLRQGKEALEYHEYRKGAYRSKGSLFVEKLISVSEDFAEQIKKIAAETGMPVSSLLEIAEIMTSEKGPSQIYGNYAVNVPRAVRDPVTLLLEVSERLEKLFLEAFLVLMIAGLADYVITVAVFMRFNNLDNIKKHLVEKACFIEMERRINDIITSEDLNEYISDELEFFGTVFPVFAGFCLKHIRFIARKRFQLTQTPVGIQQDPFEFNDSDDDDDKEDRKNKWIVKNIERTEKGTDSDLKAFEDELRLTASKKLLYEPLRTYKLQGHPASLLKYTTKKIENVALSIVERHYNNVIKNKIGMSTRSLRRWERESREGKILMPASTNSNNPPTIKDLHVYYIDKIRDGKLLKQKHAKLGHFSQRELIHHLNSEEFRSIFFNKYKQEFLTYSESTLRNKIKVLLEQNVIKAEETDNSRLFKCEDIIHIAHSILKMKAKK